MRGPAPKTVEDYVAAVASDDARACLEHLRGLIRKEIPAAEEVISYGIPCYKLNGYVIGFAAFKKHCSVFPGHTVADFSDALKGYKTSKGTIQFTPDNPIPDNLIKAIIRARVQENTASAEAS